MSDLRCKRDTALPYDVTNYELSKVATNVLRCDAHTKIATNLCTRYSTSNSIDNNGRARKTLAWDKISVQRILPCRPASEYVAKNQQSISFKTAYTFIPPGTLPVSSVRHAELRSGSPHCFPRAIRSPSRTSPIGFRPTQTPSSALLGSL